MEIRLFFFFAHVKTRFCVSVAPNPRRSTISVQSRNRSPEPSSTPKTVHSCTRPTDCTSSALHRNSTPIASAIFGIASLTHTFSSLGAGSRFLSLPGSLVPGSAPIIAKGRFEAWSPSKSPSSIPTPAIPSSLSCWFTSLSTSFRDRA